jgi:hypothetical protein
VQHCLCRLCLPLGKSKKFDFGIFLQTSTCGNVQNEAVDSGKSFVWTALLLGKARGLTFIMFPQIDRCDSVQDTAVDLASSFIESVPAVRLYRFDFSFSCSRK